MEREELCALADHCRAEDKRKTPERLWLGERFETYYQKIGIRKKSDGDALLYGRIFGEAPKSSSDILKIRYWRTGNTMPSNRALLLSLGKALELTEEQLRYLVLCYYDRSDRAFSDADRQDPVYLSRCALLRELKQEFLMKLPPIFLRSLGIRRTEAERYFRHLFFLESLTYTIYAPQVSELMAETMPNSHLLSVSYASTLRDMLELRGEISRKSILRLLILLMAPFLSRDLLSDHLMRLGFSPLDEEHQLPGGGRLDALLIGILSRYEEECRGQDPEKCKLWLKQTFRQADRYLAETKCGELRFLHYRTIARGGNPA